jgi:hypothetical protein
MLCHLLCHQNRFDTTSHKMLTPLRIDGVSPFVSPHVKFQSAEHKGTRSMGRTPLKGVLPSAYVMSVSLVLYRGVFFRDTEAVTVATKELPGVSRLKKGCVIFKKFSKLLILKAKLLCHFSKILKRSSKAKRGRLYQYIGGYLTKATSRVIMHS